MNQEPLFFFFVPFRKMIYFPDCYAQPVFLTKLTTLLSVSYSVLLSTVQVIPTTAHLLCFFPVQNGPHMLPTGLISFPFQGQVKKYRKSNPPTKFHSRNQEGYIPSRHISSLLLVGIAGNGAGKSVTLLPPLKLQCTKPSWCMSHIFFCNRKHLF